MYFLGDMLSVYLQHFHNHWIAKAAVKQLVHWSNSLWYISGISRKKSSHAPGWGFLQENKKIRNPPK